MTCFRCGLGAAAEGGLLEALFNGSGRFGV